MAWHGMARHGIAQHNTETAFRGEWGSGYSRQSSRHSIGIEGRVGIVVGIVGIVGHSSRRSVGVKGIVGIVVGVV